MPRLNKPSLKMKKFAKAYVENGGNGVQAALASYDADYNNAQKIAHDNLEKPLVIEEINRLLEKTGLTDDQYIATNIKTIIDNGVHVKVTAKEALNALNMLLKVKNAYPKNVNKSMSVRYNYSSDTQSLDKLTEAITQMNNTTASLLEDLKSKE